MAGDLTDAQWEAIKDLLPPPRRRGRPRADDRRTLNGILYVLRTGCRWQDLPRRYGSPVTCWWRLQEWEREGVWELIWRTYLSLLDERGGAGVGSDLPGRDLRPGKKGGEGVGVTKRGKGSKVMLVTDGQGVPIGGLVAGGQPAEAALKTVRVPRRRGMPRSRPWVLVADKGYDSEALRRALRRRGIRPCIPRRRNQRRRGRKVDLGPYRSRWVVERTFAWLGRYRGLVVRYERSLEVFRAFLPLAFILICLDRILK